MPAKKTTVNEIDEMMQKNTRFYSKFMTTPKEAQKQFNNGSFSGTDINPMWRIMILTEVFGPSGFGWWTQNVKYEMVESEATKEISVFCELELVVKDPETGEVSQPIYGIGGNTYVRQGRNGARTSDEAKKMAYTDAMSIACKSLGIGHDIWYQNDRTKYTYNEPASNNNELVPNVTPMREEKPAEHTQDTASLIDEISRKLTEIGKGMDKGQKLNFAKETIVPILGTMNYKTCTDINKLTELRNKLSA